MPKVKVMMVSNIKESCNKYLVNISFKIFIEKNKFK